VKNRYLLDTQTFLVAAQADGPLTPRAKNTLLRADHALYLSLISLWEMQIKISLGKLRLPVSLSETVQRAVTELGLEILPLLLEHIYQLGDLPWHHRDPFDRLLIAQALSEQMVLVGSDPMFEKYGVRRLW
jgi:PIN domain nuclease of toxin-antitoxin system